MKRFLSIVLALCMVFTLCACGNDTNNGGSADSGKYDKISIDLSCNGQSDTANDCIGANLFKQYIEEQSGGAITVTIYNNDQLAGGNMTKGLELVMDGTITARGTDPIAAANLSCVSEKKVSSMSCWISSSAAESSARESSVLLSARRAHAHTRPYSAKTLSSSVAAPSSTYKMIRRLAKWDHAPAPPFGKRRCSSAELSSHVTDRLPPSAAISPARISCGTDTPAISKLSFRPPAERRLTDTASTSSKYSSRAVSNSRYASRICPEGIAVSSLYSPQASILHRRMYSSDSVSARISSRAGSAAC